MTDEARQAAGPLEGLLVLDFSQLIAGPMAAMTMADLGARVIKIESPAGDSARQLDPSPDGTFLGLFDSLNRNKESIVLNLRDPGDNALALRLVDRADVLVESARVGVMERLGLGYETVRDRNPRLIYLSVTGYGERGPNARRGGVDMALQAETGWMDITGEPDGPPVKIGATPLDASTGHVAAQGLLAALLMRERTGRGDHIKVSLYDVGCHLHAQDFTQYLMTGFAVTRTGNFPAMSTPAGIYETADGTLALAAYLQHHWEAAAEIFGDPSLREDPRFATVQCRRANGAVLIARLQEIMRTRTTAEWREDFERAGLTNAVVRNIEQVVESDQFTAAELLLEFGEERPVRTVRSPVRYETIHRDSHTPAPRLDADRERLVREFMPVLTP